MDETKFILLLIQFLASIPCYQIVVVSCLTLVSSCTFSFLFGKYTGVELFQGPYT
jgi:hypothetical protein